MCIRDSITGCTSGAKARVVNTISPITFVPINNTDFEATETITGAESSETATLDTFTAGSRIVTNDFTLDTGQRDNFYDIGRLVRKPNTIAPTGRLIAICDYFTHGTSDFFNVDSYSSINYKEIPTYSATLVDPEFAEPSGEFDLRDTVDFRPRVADAGGAFTGTGAITAHAPTRFTQLETDIQFYLGRIDKVFLDSKGNFGIAGGVPSRYPEPPEIQSDSMHLYTMTIPAYTLTADEVTLDFIDNRRYTMRDICRIDKRISQIEYYSVLSFLEAEAQNKQILDSNNDPRWKSGFLVDAFSNTRMGNSASAEYRAAIDIKNRIPVSYTHLTLPTKA